MYFKYITANQTWSFHAAAQDIHLLYARAHASQIMTKNCREQPFEYEQHIPRLIVHRAYVYSSPFMVLWVVGTYG